MERIWTPAKVGCHWSSGDYSISTVTEYSTAGRGRSYYGLCFQRNRIAEAETLAQAKAAAERHAKAEGGE